MSSREPFAFIALLPWEKAVSAYLVVKTLTPGLPDQSSCDFGISKSCSLCPLERWTTRREGYGGAYNACVDLTSLFLRTIEVCSEAVVSRKGLCSEAVSFKRCLVQRSSHVRKVSCAAKQPCSKRAACNQAVTVPTHSPNQEKKTKKERKVSCALKQSYPSQGQSFSTLNYFKIFLQPFIAQYLSSSFLLSLVLASSSV